MSTAPQRRRYKGELAHLSVELAEIFRDLGIGLRLEPSATGKRIRSVLLPAKDSPTTNGSSAVAPEPRP